MQPPVQTMKNLGKWRPYKVRGLFSQPIRTWERNGLPSAKQGLSKSESRHAMLFTPFRYTPTSPCPTVTFHAEPISQGHCWKWYHNIQILWWIYSPLVVKGLNLLTHLKAVESLFLVHVFPMWVSFRITNVLVVTPSIRGYRPTQTQRITQIAS